MTDKNTPETLNDADLADISGGPSLNPLEFRTIEGESKKSFDTVTKRDIGTGARSTTGSVPVDNIAFNFTQVKHEY